MFPSVEHVNESKAGRRFHYRGYEESTNGDGLYEGAGSRRLLSHFLQKHMGFYGQCTASVYKNMLEGQKVPLEAAEVLLELIPKETQHD